MLWYCRFTWQPGTTTERVRQRVLQQHAAGTNHPELIKGWYDLAGAGAGFLLIEAEDPRDLNNILEPYMDLVAWEVHGAYELSYEAVTDRFAQMFAGVERERFARTEAIEAGQGELGPWEHDYLMAGVVSGLPWGDD